MKEFTDPYLVLNHEDFWKNVYMVFLRNEILLFIFQIEVQEKGSE